MLEITGTEPSSRWPPSHFGQEHGQVLGEVWGGQGASLAGYRRD